jgi:hypothetical protein
MGFIEDNFPRRNGRKTGKEDPLGAFIEELTARAPAPEEESEGTTDEDATLEERLASIGTKAELAASFLEDSPTRDRAVEGFYGALRADPATQKLFPFSSLPTELVETSGAIVAAFLKALMLATQAGAILKIIDGCGRRDEPWQELRAKAGRTAEKTAESVIDFVRLPATKEVVIYFLFALKMESDVVPDAAAARLYEKIAALLFKMKMIRAVA